jgi:hypothetical protein
MTRTAAAPGAALAAAYEGWSYPWLTGPFDDAAMLARPEQTRQLAAMLLAAPLGTEIDGLVIYAGGWSRERGAEADAAGDAGSLEWLAALGPHEHATLTADGRAAVRDQWCQCASTPAAGWVRYEHWTARGRESHGFVCPACRRLTQAGLGRTGQMTSTAQPRELVHKRGALHTLTRGDRLCWPSVGGCSAVGTVTSVGKVHWTEGVNGPVFSGITVTLRVPRCPAFDGWGWPVSEPRTLTKTFRFSADLEWAYTPAAPAAPRTITLLLGCRHSVTIVSGATTGELMADDVTCPECGTPQWVTGTRDHESGQS